MLVVTICFVCAWLPYAILSVIGQFVSFQTVGPYANTAAALIAKSYIAFDPVVYVLMDESFRKRMLNIFQRLDVGASRGTTEI